MIIDAWMQHFGESQLTHPISPRCGLDPPELCTGDARDDYRRDG
jgi:hypothetical protein